MRVYDRRGVGVPSNAAAQHGVQRMVCHVPFKGLYSLEIIVRFVGRFSWQTTANASRSATFTTHSLRLNIEVLSPDVVHFRMMF